MSIATQQITAEELFGNHPRERCELVRGELHILSPAGGEHGWVVLKVSIPLGTFIESQQSGHVFGAETGFIIARNPDTVRAPDVAFVKAGRFSGKPVKSFVPFAPDLAVEVLSPFDSASEVQAKVEEWLNAGTHAVWVIDPQRESALICRTSQDGVLSLRVEELSDDLLLPGFRLPVKQLFE